MLKFIKDFFKNISKKSLLATVFFLIIAFSFLLIKSVYSAVALSISVPPLSISWELPTTKARATADAGDTIVSASYQIYNSDYYPQGAWQDCTSDSGYTFGADRIVNFSCIVPSLSSGSYKMNVRALSSDGSSKSLETAAFIVDREAPGITFNNLPGNPLLIKNNKPIFTGSAMDALTSVLSVEYKWTSAETNDPVPSGFGDSGWSPCSITGSGKSVSFTCNPNHTFSDSVKGGEYRMHVRATDETNNRSGSANYYKFQVDTTPPYNLEITHPNEGGITLHGNDYYNINWTTPLDAYELGSGPIKIEYSTTGAFTGEEVLINNNLTASGPYSWRVPGFLDTSNAKIKITASDLAGNSVSSISANPFTVIPDSVPSVSINSIPGDITNLAPINFKATASDSQGIISADYRINSGSWVSCIAQDGSFGDNFENIECNGVSVSEGTYSISVRARNNLNNTGYAYYNFTYDSSPPLVNAGSLGTINLATRPGASISDQYSSISSRTWQKVSGPGSITFGGGSYITDPYISASANGSYQARLSACDAAGNCASDTLNFTWTDNPLGFSINSPAGGERLRGANNFLISWTDPEGAADYNFHLSYSSNGGSTWNAISHPVLNKSTRTYNWTLPSVSTQNARVRVEVKDTYGSTVLSDNSNIFTIDSLAPTVNAGSIPGIITSATSPGASASDNFDTAGELNYSWSSVEGPSSASVVFGGGTNILNPSLSGTVTGLYTARLSVTDRVGNSASDTISFNFDGNPPNFSVLEPTGIYYQGGENATIVWEPSSGANYYKLEYSLDGANNFSTITSSTGGTALGANLSYDWAIPFANSNQAIVRVSAYDQYNNNVTALSATFYIDSSAPIVDAGNLGLIYVPKSPGASASDGDGSGIAGYAWSKLSGPGNINFGGGSNILNPIISADTSGSYTLRLRVTDNLGMSDYDDVSLYYEVEPPVPIISSPGSDEFWAGASSKNIKWEITNPGDLDNFLISYALNNDDPWIDIATVPASARSYTWSVPAENTTEAKIRLIVSDIDGNTTSAIRSFSIDSIAPVINIGSIGSATHAASSGTTVSDNIDSEADMKFIWKGVGAPAGGTLVFSDHGIVDPEMMGTVSGDYSAQIIVQDRAGHISSKEMTFYWNGDPDIPIVTSPDSTVFISGGNNQNIEWYIAENSDLSHFIISHSLNNGDTWSEIATTSASVRSYSWDIQNGTNSAFSGSSLVKVEAVDIYANKNNGLSPHFTIDSVAPDLIMGIISSPINEPTGVEGISVSDNIDEESELSFNWSVLSLPYPEASLNISDINATSTYFSGNMSGEYEALLTVSDRSSNIATSSISFIWNSLHDPVLISPASGDFLAGGKDTNLVWSLVAPDDLLRIETQYSIDNGNTWLDIDNNIAASSTSFVWQVPDNINSTSSRARMMTVNTANIKATSTSGLFTIDSTPPTVDAGSFIDSLKSPTKPGASASDNFDDASQLRYSWTQQLAPRRGAISFGGEANILNPSISGNINGSYVALLSVFDRAGNSASDTVSFERYVSSGGGGGGSNSPSCIDVVYSDWGDCYNGVRYRSIVSSTPGVCTPTSAQRAAQEQACSSSSNAFFCQSVEYGPWSDCVNGIQNRKIINYSPNPCDPSSEQIAQRQRSCSGDSGVPPTSNGPFDEDALSVMENARKNFSGTDKNLLARLSGQILIQVEEQGQAWYVSAADKQRYYLGSPTNAFSVMSLIGLGIKNDRLFKLPVGLLDGSLSMDKDSDGDGLSDRLEEALLTNKFKRDSDGDGHDDRTEVLNGYNPNGPGMMPFDAKVLQASLGHIYIQVETNGEAWYVEPKTKKRYYLGRPNEAFAIMNKFGVGITNQDLNKIPVGRFSEAQLARITRMLEDRKRELRERNK